MRRPIRDGTRARSPTRRRLSAVFLKKVKPQSRAFLSGTLTRTLAVLMPE
jgi:hypothetical protein